jgi:hypothetical protein
MKSPILLHGFQWIYIRYDPSARQNLSLIRQKFLPWYFPSMFYAVSAIQQRPAMRWCDKMIATLDGDLRSTAGKRET